MKQTVHKYTQYISYIPDSLWILNVKKQKWCLSEVSKILDKKGKKLWQGFFKQNYKGSNMWWKDASRVTTCPMKRLTTKTVEGNMKELRKARMPILERHNRRKPLSRPAIRRSLVQWKASKTWPCIAGTAHAGYTRQFLHAVAVTRDRRRDAVGDSGRE